MSKPTLAILGSMPIPGTDDDLSDPDKNITLRIASTAVGVGWQSLLDEVGPHPIDAVLITSRTAVTQEYLGHRVATAAANPPLAIVNFGGGLPTDLGAFTFRSLSFAAPDFYQALEQWLTSLVPTFQLRQHRGTIEALTGWVSLNIVENQDIHKRIDELTRNLEQVSGELTEAQIDLRTAKALLAQLERQNEALVLELSKRAVEPEGASFLVKAMSVAGSSLLNLLIVMGGTYAATRAALPDTPAPQPQQIQDLRAELTQRCEQTVIVLNSEPAGPPEGHD